MPTRVLIIDDSAMVRKLLTRVLSEDADIEVVGTAPDPFVGRNRIVQLSPDVVLLDVEMPRMDGITFLSKLMAYHPLPVIVVSSLTTQGSGMALEALRNGAVDVVAKPSGAHTLGDLSAELIVKIKGAHGAKVARLDPGALSPCRLEPPKLAGANATHRIVAIGASTGGTRALELIVQRLPAGTPGIVVVQHMPQAFTGAFAKRLDGLSALEVKEAEDDDLVIPGRMLIAPGGRHLRVVRSGALYRVQLVDVPPVNRHRPSADVLFDSVADSTGRNALGLVLTGMGEDGARGLLKMRQAGAHTLAQDEASSVVYGMPRAAVELGAAEASISLERVPEAILRFGSHEQHATSSKGVPV